MMGRYALFWPFGTGTTAVLGFGFLGCLGLGFYEMTAKSPTLLGRPLPGWRATVRVEKVTRWNPPTGILPLDKFLHEGEEACRFYRNLALQPLARSPLSRAVS